MISQLVRIAQVPTPTSVTDTTLGYVLFQDLPIPQQGAVCIEGSFYNVLGFTMEMTLGTPDQPGKAQIALKIMKMGAGIVAAPAVALDLLKKELPAKIQ